MKNQRKYDKKDLKRRIEELGWWFHCFNLDGILTNPDTPYYPEDRWKLIEPYVLKDLSGKTVLDLGCCAGYFAIKMKQRGAGYVLALDSDPRYIEQAKFVSEYYGVSIDLRQMNVYEFVLKNRRKFDIVLFLGLFYHLRYPLLLLDKVAEMTAEKLYFQTEIVGRSPVSANAANLPWEQRKLILLDNYSAGETQIFDHPDYPKMFFIEKAYNNDYSNWWVSNETCVYAMLRSAGFRNIIKSGINVFICDPPDTKYMEAIGKNFEHVMSRIPTMD